MKTAAEKEFNRVSNKFYEWTRKARTAAENYLKEVLEQQKDKTIELDPEYYEEDVSVIYDGGNHPEYAGNIDSHVYAVYMKDGSVNLKIDDSDEYDIDRVSTLDLLTICEAIKSSWLPRHIGLAM